jgi:cytoskeletal protein CcmA (bactofilin family)
MRENLYRVFVVALLVVCVGLSALNAFVPPEQPEARGAGDFGQYGSIQIVSNGNLKVGNGTPDTTLNGEDAYVEGTFEGDGNANLDGNLDVDGTTNLDDLDVDASGEIEIDGGLTDFGGGTCGVADGDNDVCIAAVLEVDGETELDGALDADSTANFAGAVTLQGALYSSFTDLAVSDGDTITPTYTTYALDTSGAVTITLAASAQEGQLLVLVGDDSNTITINDTNLRSNDGSAQTLGQYDALMFVYQDSEWIEISDSPNS